MTNLFKLKNNSSKWFFNDYLKSKSKGDYSIKKISSNKSLSTYRISKSNEIINFPTKLSFTENNKIIDEKWLMFKNNDTIVSFYYIIFI